MQLPREIIVGSKILDLVGDLCKRLGFSRSALIVTGPLTYKIAGRSVFEILKKEGLDVRYQIINSNVPTLKDVDETERVIQSLRPDVVLGIGGGTKIDIAKLSSARQGVPFISIPTTASHDGMASPFASIKGMDRPYSIMAQSPIAIIADTDVIMRSPYRFIASGCGDVIAKYTANKDWELAHKRVNEYIARYTASLALMSARHVSENSGLIYPGSEEGVRVLLEALVSCGVAMGIAGTSRPCSGSEHLFSHALDMIAPRPAMHGEQCGVGTILMSYLHGMDWEYIRYVLEKVGAPVDAKGLGIEPRHVIEALVLAGRIRPERYTILNEKPLSFDSARKLAEETGVI
ncbi:NAD(P)-dependent glycerol-1-phosphate dehydrogenase [Candidatus Bathyarchaeota archaeon]|nr:MAG: NAD(P)-dependent glycerol-1-phosphate dehydrogenase [Candidatus Bathyarchaeota archaeon]